MKKIFASAVAIIFMSVLLINCGGDSKPAAKKAKSMLNKAKTEVANTVETAKTELKVDLANGEATYKKVCIACHLTGVAGAAALKDKKRWEENAAKGMATLHKSVINGVPKGKYGVMPARGTCSDCSDQDLYDAVGYMLKTAGVTAK